MSIEADGRFTIAFRFDTLAFALNDTSARIGNEPMDTLMAGPREELATTLAKAGMRLGRGCKLQTDAGEGTVESVVFPNAAEVLAWRDNNQPVLPVVIPAQVSGRLPAGAKTVACRFPSVLEQVILTLERPGEEPEAEAVEAGHFSETWPLHLDARPLRTGPGTLPSQMKPATANLASTAGADDFSRIRWAGVVVLCALGAVVAIWVWKRWRMASRASGG